MKREDIAFGLAVSATFAALIFATLDGCGESIFDQKFATQPTLDSVQITVVWVTPDRIHGTCGNEHAYACATVGTFDNPRSTIYAIRPNSFSDTVRVEALGHELLHALGARH